MLNHALQHTATRYAVQRVLTLLTPLPRVLAVEGGDRPRRLPMLDGDDHGPFLTAEQLPQSGRGMIEALSCHDDHPARGWFERIGNGIFEDDSSVSGLPAPHAIYRFRQGRLVAYVWQSQEGWFVRPWQCMRGTMSNAVVRVTDLRAALDLLARPLRPWWRCWR